MAKYLISTTEMYRVDSEAEAARLIEEAKHSDKYILSKYSSTYKERKKNGEIIDAWHRVILTKVFDEEKEPMNSIGIEYNDEGSAF